MIKFIDFFNVKFPNETKVKFNMNNNGTPRIQAWDFLRCNDGSPEYQEWIKMNAYRTAHPNNNLDNAKYLLAFAQYYPLGPQYYIFGGMYEIKIPTQYNTGYTLTLLNDYKEYRKRLIIKLKKPVGQSYTRGYNNIQTSLDPEIYEVLPTQAIEDFPGFNKVLLTHKELEYIYANNAPEWKRQLSSVKGVYCITDTNTGKLYIGSAYGNAGLWQRWQEYANPKKLTGGNKAFEDLKNKYSDDYIINNFTYSILEIFDPKTQDQEILDRESFWKKVFQTIKFGMNN